ncbi:MAG TPA: class I SAM-dependent methyltransferase [Gemmatimonadales bacterium]|nr:class I SAM-dependent methyltransferase [Gemmatimonadales bacterium]
MTDRSNGYERVAGEFLAGRGSGKGYGIGTNEVRAWATGLPRGAAVLDLGCGAGLPLTAVLVEAGLEVAGIDASATLLAAFRRRFPEVPAACEAVEDSDFFGRRFDAVLAWGLFFLLPARTQEGLIARIAERLNEGGRLLFTAPAPQVTWSDAMTRQPSRSLGADRYRRLLAAAGFGTVREYEDEGENHYYDAMLEGRR